MAGALGVFGLQCSCLSLPARACSVNILNVSFPARIPCLRHACRSPKTRLARNLPLEGELARLVRHGRGAARHFRRIAPPTYPFLGMGTTRTRCGMSRVPLYPCLTRDDTRLFAQTGALLHRHVSHENTAKNGTAVVGASREAIFAWMQVGVDCPVHFRKRFEHPDTFSRGSPQVVAVSFLGGSVQHCKASHFIVEWTRNHRVARSFASGQVQFIQQLQIATIPPHLPSSQGLQRSFWRLPEARIGLGLCST